MLSFEFLVFLVVAPFFFLIVAPFLFFGCGKRKTKNSKIKNKTKMKKSK